MTLHSLANLMMASSLQLHNYSSMEGVLYCKPHFEQLFKEAGSFNKNFQSRTYFHILRLQIKILLFCNHLI